VIQAFKYGDVSKPPALSLNVEPLDDGATRVRLSLELREDPSSTSNHRVLHDRMKAS
jgi:hypothetical protein